jgi:hypothetical protein
LDVFPDPKSVKVTKVEAVANVVNIVFPVREKVEVDVKLIAGFPLSYITDPCDPEYIFG